MEFTKLLKYGSASIFIVLLVIGLVLGFSTPLLIIMLALLASCLLLEQNLIKSEREQFNTKLKEILTSNRKSIDCLIEEHKQIVMNLHEKYELDLKMVQQEHKSDLADVMKKIDYTHSQINTLKLGQGMIRKN